VDAVAELSGARPAATITRIRVVIVDDDALVRAGLRMILAGASDIEIVGEASDGIQALDVVAAAAPRVVLMDIRMPRRDGLEATRLLLESQRQSARLRPASVIVLTTFDTDELVLEALRIGASGFLLKDTPPERLVQAVRDVAAGHPILSPSVTAQLIARVSSVDDTRRGAALARLDVLTAREREVAIAVGRGMSNAEISGELFMSVSTVKTHGTRLLAKLGADNRVQIALTVHDAGLT
jgi:DNA-binding NarL/FixJ family response regulator